MRLFSRRGKDRVKGEEEVEESVQNRKTAVMATASAVQLNEIDIVVFNWCGLRVCGSCLEISWGYTLRCFAFRVGSRMDLWWQKWLCSSIRLLLRLW